MYKNSILAIENNLGDITTYNRAKQLILNEEERFGTPNKIDEQAFQLSASKKPMPKPNHPCEVCHKKGHWAKDCFKNRNRYQPKGKTKGPPERAKCKYCGFNNHASDNCRYKPLPINAVTKIGSPPEQRREEWHAFVTNQQNHGWIVDSGASGHMTGDPALLTDIKPAPTVNIKLPNNEILQSNQIGKATLPEHKTVLNSVRLVKGLTSNLISVSQLTNGGYKVLFDRNGCQILDQNENSCVKATLHNNLYALLNNISPTSVTTKQNFLTWHRRLAHCGRKPMIEIMKHNLIEGASWVNDDETKCEGCLLGKASRSPFTSTTSRATTPLELVCTDLAGPITPISLGGGRYILNIIDAATNFVHVETLKTKDQATEKLHVWIAWAETTTTQRKLKAIRFDGGGEFNNKNNIQWLKNRGITIQKTQKASSASNGMVERAHRTIFNKVRAMLADTKLPKTLWGEAAVTAGKMHNLTPTSSNPSKTPFQEFIGRKPEAKHLRAFGCASYVHIQQPAGQKAAPRAMKGWFVGYSVTSSGWRVWIPENNRIVESRDVKFIEHEFPFTTDNKETIVKDDSILIDSSEEIATEEPETTTSPHHDSHEKTEEEPSLTSTTPENQREDFPITPPESTETVEPLKHPPEKQEQTTQAPQLATSDSKPTEKNLAPKKPSKQPKLQKQTTPTHNYNLRDRKKTPNKTVLVAEQQEVPSTYSEAIRCNDKDLWMRAMQEEIDGLEKMQVWTPHNSNEHPRTISCRWTYRIKPTNPPTYKARLVARGFSQVEGIDYEETYSPVVSDTAVRVLLTIAATLDWELHQVDVVMAYPNAKLKEQIFIKPPPGFEEKYKSTLRLNKALYGLKQSGREWWKLMDSTLQSVGLFPIQDDKCMYTNKNPNINELVIALLHVDDLLISTKNKKNIDLIIPRLKTAFNLKEKCDEHISGFLGIDILRDRTNKHIHLSQKHFIKELLQETNMTNCHPANTPLPSNYKPEEKSSQCETILGLPFRTVVGKLAWLASKTRPDLSFAVNSISRYVNNPTVTHCEAAKRIIRYIKGTQNYTLQLGCRDLPSLKEIHLAVDADWAGDHNTRKSTEGYLINWGGSCIRWTTKMQQNISLSTAEAELGALIHGAQDAIWIRKIVEQITNTGSSLHPPEHNNKTSLEYFGFQTKGGIKIRISEDNKSVLHIIQNEDVKNRKTKHVDLAYKWLIQTIKTGDISAEWVPSQQQPADPLTKNTSKEKLQKLLRHTALVNPELLVSVAEFSGGVKTSIPDS